MSRMHPGIEGLLPPAALAGVRLYFARERDRLEYFSKSFFGWAYRAKLEEFDHIIGELFDLDAIKAEQKHEI